MPRGRSFKFACDIIPDSRDDSFLKIKAVIDFLNIKNIQTLTSKDRFLIYDQFIKIGKEIPELVTEYIESFKDVHIFEEFIHYLTCKGVTNDIIVNMIVNTKLKEIHSEYFIRNYLNHLSL